MLKREGWQTFQEAQRAATKPTDEDWVRLFARLARELESRSSSEHQPKKND